MPASTEAGAYTELLSTNFPCRAWVANILTGSVWNASQNRFTRRRWLMMMLYAADNVQKTELHIMPFEGALIESVEIVSNERFPAAIADDAVFKILSKRSPAAFNSAHWVTSNVCRVSERIAAASVPAKIPAGAEVPAAAPANAISIDDG
eukprot:5253396-Pleurochrysis_carterae.AAC.1